MDLQQRLIQASFDDDDEQYREFVKKFSKCKKGTDECYTPPEIYEVVKNWVLDHYELEESVDIVRPFYPNGDYTREHYSPNSIVIDNPPFSLSMEIIRYYNRHKIRYFLFANGLTIFQLAKEKDTNIVITDSNIKYHNGAIINTNFVTNLGNDKLLIPSSLIRLIKGSQHRVKINTKYSYPQHLISIKLASSIARRELDFALSRNECIYIDDLDGLKAIKKSLFGGGLLISTDAQARCPELSSDEIPIELSDREKKLIRYLDGERLSMI